jgi:hypothetical protein
MKKQIKLLSEDIDKKLYSIDKILDDHKEEYRKNKKQVIIALIVLTVIGFLGILI